MQSNNFLLDILYAGFCRVEREWQYKNIISPFTRLYVFTGGQGAVYMNQQRFELKQGDLFIIPKFTSHSYECEDFNEHFYVCFFDELLLDQHGFFEGGHIEYQRQANQSDRVLMERLVELNATKKLPFLDPLKYDNCSENLPFNNPTPQLEASDEFESYGILLQLLSRFISPISPQSLRAKSNSKERLSSVLYFINNNLDGHLSVEMLAQRMCMSCDNFSRVFKRVMGITPSQYIQRSRIQRAQTLLLTTAYSIEQVGAAVGIANLSQFSTLFRKITSYSPRGYVRAHHNIDYHEEK